MLSFQALQITEASAAKYTFEDLSVLVRDVIGVDIRSRYSILMVRTGRGTG